MVKEIIYLCILISTYNMKRLLLLTLSVITSFSIQAQDCDDLFISEYVVGSGNNRALEIYNPTDAAVSPCCRRRRLPALDAAASVGVGVGGCATVESKCHCCLWRTASHDCWHHCRRRRLLLELMLPSVSELMLPSASVSLAVLQSTATQLSPVESHPRAVPQT